MERKHVPSNRNKKSKAGFTIVEMVLVIALLMLLAGVVITQIDGIWGDATEDVAKFQVQRNFKTPLTKYRIDMGGYPSTAEGLNALLEAPADRAHLWKGPYVDSIPLDPWNTAYKYKFPGDNNPRGYDLSSAGPDRQFNTADDIGNWKQE